MCNGAACAVFNDIDNTKWTVSEKGEAILRVMDMETNNGITKKAMLKVIRWLWHMVFEEVKG